MIVVRVVIGMGLGFVEIVMAVEDTFQVHFGDNEFGNVLTVGDLYNLLLTKLPCGAPSGQCVTSVAFYRLRRGLVEHFGASRKEVKPSTPMAAMVPRRNRRRRWKALSVALGLKLPRLEMPGWLCQTVLVLALAGALVVGGRSPYTLLYWILFFALGAALSLPIHIQFSAPTAGDLARQVASTNYAKLVGNHMNKAEVWQILRQVFVAQAGVNIEDVTPEVEIVHGLGID
jgi:hypothetical protein